MLCGRGSVSRWVAVVALALVLAGCGESGNGSRASACFALDLAPVSRASDAGRTLRSAIAADQAALAALDAGDPLAARLRAAKARAEQALASFTGDPLGSRTMSPSATILPTARRVIAETRALRKQFCPPA